MTYPPPPNQPSDDPYSQPPAGSGGFGPPTGYGPPDPYAQPAPNAQPNPYGQPGPPMQPGPPTQPMDPANPYGGRPPAGYGGYGPPGQPGWPGQPPGGPPPGGNRTKVIAIVAGAVAVVALTVGGVVAFSGGGDSDDEGKGGASPSVTASATGSTPSPEDSLDFGDPTDEASDTLPDDSASSPNFEDIMPTPTSGPRPSYMLQVGDCFNLVEEKDGYADPASCNGSHDAEVVYKTKLEGEFDSDSAIRSKAESLCEDELNRVGKRQPSGTVSQTLVQYPSAGGVRLGMRTVTCSLAASSGDKLTAPLD